MTKPTMTKQEVIEGLKKINIYEYNRLLAAAISYLEQSVEDVWIEHRICEGSRQHVLSYDANGQHCSEPNCIINKPLPPDPIYITNYQERIKHFSGCQCAMCKVFPPEDKPVLPEEFCIEDFDGIGHKILAERINILIRWAHDFERRVGK